MADTLEQKPDDKLDDKLNPINRALAAAEESAAQTTTPNDSPVQESIGIHPERAEAEAAELERQFASKSATEQTYDNDDSNNDQVGEKGYTGDGKKKGLRGKLRGFSNTRKFVIFGAAGAGGGLIGILILLFILASSLEIPNLMQNITTYQFARLTRQYAESANRVTEEKLASDALDDSTWKSALKDKYQNLRDNTWGKFDSYRPEKVMENLKGSDNFQTIYQRTATGRLQLKGVTLIDRTYLPVERSAVQRFTPGLSSVLEFKDNTALAKQVAPALDAALRVQDVGPIVRYKIASQIRQELGISLVAWHLGDYKGKDDKAARLQEAREKATAVDEKAPSDNSVTDSTSEGVSNAEDTAKKVLADDKELQATIDNGGVSTSVKSAISNALAKSGIQDALSVVNPIYGVAMPACIVYDGSLDHSGPTIDNQTKQQVAQYNYLNTGADTLKYGSPNTDSKAATELGVAARATTKDLGDISGSNAMKRASGETVNTSEYVSPEASAGGEFTLLNATPGIPSGVADTINSLADDVCPTLTNVWGGAVIGVVNLGIGFLTGGEADAAEEAAGTAATQVIDHASENIVERVVSNSVGRLTTKATRLKSLLYDAGKSTAKIAATTIAAKLIVNSRAGTINGGFSQGQPLADGADSGAGIYSGMINQKELYGRPLTSEETAQSDAADRVTIALQNSSKSMYDRYLATDNSFSLVSRMAMSVSSEANHSFFRMLINLATTLFHPLTYAGSFATSLSGHAQAAPTEVDQHYGNVQFGWSEAEEKLIDSTPSYRVHLQNQKVLDDTNMANEISDKYSKCFTKSIGDLLAAGDIQRDSDGNVLADRGDCAPNNLGPNNSQYGDLVFRWRLANASNNTVDQLVDDQTVTNSTNSDQTDNSGSDGTITGDSAALAKQVLANPNITLDSGAGHLAKEDVTAAASGQKVTPGPISGQSNGSASTSACKARTPVVLDATLLQGMLNIAAKYKYEIGDITSGHDCDSGRHPLGRAMDIFSVNGKQISGHCTDADIYGFLKDTTGIMSRLQPNGKFVNARPVGMSGIGSCNSAEDGNKPAWVPGNINYFYDASDEIHVDTGVAP